jgi:hypothetical protein
VITLLFVAQDSRRGLVLEGMIMAQEPFAGVGCAGMDPRLALLFHIMVLFGPVAATLSGCRLVR